MDAFLKLIFINGKNKFAQECQNLPGQNMAVCLPRQISYFISFNIRCTVSRICFFRKISWKDSPYGG